MAAGPGATMCSSSAYGVRWSLIPCICMPATVWRRHVGHFATISGSIIASGRIRALADRPRITSMSWAPQWRRRHEIRAVAGHCAGQATPSRRDAPQRQSIGRIGRESIHRDSKRCSDEPGHACSTRQALAWYTAPFGRHGKRNRR